LFRKEKEGKNSGKAGFWDFWDIGTYFGWGGTTEKGKGKVLF